MKKILAVALYALPLAMAPAVYAQSSAGSGAGTAGNSSAGSSGATQAAPSAPGNNRSSDGNAATPGAAAPGTGMGAPGSTPSKAGTSGGNAAPGAASSGSNATDISNSAALTGAVTGWSVKNKIMGKTVYNEKNDKVGDINDVILSSDGKTVYFIVGAGGFIGMGEHNVAIPFDKITETDNKLVLQGYTKDQLKAMPEYKAAK